MDKQKKAENEKDRKSVSRQEMLAYLYRHKLKKKYRPIRPHTYANSLGLRTQQLQKAPSVNLKKPIINKNVKARLESDLKYLLENQSLNAARVRKPESYISLNVSNSRRSDKSTSTVTSAQAKSQRIVGASHDKGRVPARAPPDAVQTRESNSLSLNSVAFYNAEQHRPGQRFQPRRNSLSNSEKIDKTNHSKEELSFERLPKSLPTASKWRPSRLDPFRMDDSDSFDFHSEKNQKRASHRFTTSNSSASRRTSRPISFGFDNDESFGFDPLQIQNRSDHVPSFFDAPDAVPSNRSLGEFDAEAATDWTVPPNSQMGSFNAKRPPRSRSKSSGREHASNVNNSFEMKPPSHRSSRKTVHTRIVRSSVSRVGESPFMEQIVYQRMKYKE